MRGAEYTVQFAYQSHIDTALFSGGGAQSRPGQSGLNVKPKLFKFICNEGGGVHFGKAAFRPCVQFISHGDQFFTVFINQLYNSFFCLIHDFLSCIYLH